MGAARRRSSSPAGEPRRQRPTLEDQHPAPDGERQPSAAEQRAASQTLPPLHSPPIPSSLPPALPEAAAAHQPLTLSFALAASSLEEETYPPVGLSLNTDIGFDLGDTLNTPTTTTTTGNILDGFLADTEMMAMADSEKWEKSLDDLFPDLD